MTNTIHLTAPATCTECGFQTTDIHLLANHSCEVQAHGGRCEDFPCCGHEMGDCNGLLYGSDEAIKADPHLLCDHEFGDCHLAYDEEEEDQDEDLDMWHLPELKTYAPEGTDPGEELYEV